MDENIRLIIHVLQDFSLLLDKKIPLTLPFDLELNLNLNF